MIADVAIIGFGPVGAALAGLLGKQGLRVVVIERDSEVFRLPRAAHVDHTGLRTVQELGCLDRLLPKMIRNKRLDLLNAKHEVLATIPADQPSVSNLPTSVYFYQPDFDRELRNAASSFGNVEVRLGTEMTGIVDEGHAVALRTRGPAGESVVKASFAVGCDGAWSPVREAMDLGLRSFDFDEKWLVIDLVLDKGRSNVPVDHVVEICDPVRPYLSTPIDHRRQRFEFMLLPGDDAEAMAKPDQVRALLDEWIGSTSYEVERAAAYTFHGLLAKRWRRGRVLIAGDAAHQTPPFLGQGMCAGFRDAANLAWKLARVIRSGAPDSLLDTYESERSPHARAVIEAAIRIGKVICELDSAKAEERDRRLLAGDPVLRQGLAFTLPRLGGGPLVLEGGGSLFVQPEIDGRLLDDIVGSRFLVLARNVAALGNSADWWSQVVGAHVATLAELVAPELRTWLDRRGADVVVVRPDRYVLGTGRSLEAITAKVRGALTKDMTTVASSAAC